MKTGLVSVTFRQKTPAEIIKLCKEAGLDGIEWGTDVHITSPEMAKIVRSQMDGLEIFSLGSYYRLGCGMDFSPVLETAIALGAPNIRIWAGNLEPQDASPDFRRAAVAETKKIAEQAALHGIDISFEYHGGTLTAEHSSAVELLSEINMPNVYTYWQPIFEREQGVRLAEIRQLGEMNKLKGVHVYTWRGPERLPLSADELLWKERLQTAKPYAQYALLEFVKEDDAAQFLTDANLLKQLVHA